MKLLWEAVAWEEYLYWQAHDPRMAARINRLLTEIRRHPFVGTGKPEPLRGELKTWWSRRIDDGHRLVYRPAGKGADQHVQIAQCRGHYDA